MYTLTEEYARRTVKLRHNYTLSTIDDKSCLVSHVRYRTKEHILNHCIEILMVGVCTVKLEFRFQWNTICEPTLYTIINGIARRINIIVQKLKNKIVSCIGNREVFSKYFIQTLILALFRWGI